MKGLTKRDLRDKNIQAVITNDDSQLIYEVFFPFHYPDELQA